MSPINLENYLFVGAVLFALGAIGFLARRNMIVMFLSAEMMLQGVALNLTAFARHHGQMAGQAFVLFIVAVAACEAAIALAFIIMLYRQRKSLDVSLWQDLAEEGQPPIVDEEPLPPPPSEEPLPRLTPAGVAPSQRKETSHV